MILIIFTGWIIMRFVNYVEFSYSKAMEYWQMFSYTVIAFFIPVFFSHPQLLVGTIVNATLFLAAKNLKSKYALGVIVLPSIGALLHGVLFGPFTVYLLYFIPFIWLGNSFIVYGYKYFRKKNLNPVFSALVSIAMKVVLLGAVAFVYVKLSMVPQFFIFAMSVVQMATALMGAFVSFGITWPVLRLYSKSMIEKGG